MMYTEQDLVRVAKRENNNKRKYLVVNRLQGKHIPVKPQEALAMFQALAGTLKGKYKNETLLVIGFAETATAIGAAVALELGADYMQTTREVVPDVEYLYFSEEHSHATEQKLVKDDIDRVINAVDRIVFIEDEVTTGKTILNIINIVKKQYLKQIQFSVASILNGMDDAALDAYQKYHIELFWLVKTNHAAYTEIANSYKGDGNYIVCRNDSVHENTLSDQRVWESDAFIILEKSILDKQSGMIGMTYIEMKSHMDTRRIVNPVEYEKFCEALYQDIMNQIDLGNTQNLLVLGTEEFMYPALYVANRFEEQGKDVRYHATTRSPIAVSSENEYPFHTRYELQSMYEQKRTTYIYDLKKYDMVIVITDAKGSNSADGMNSLFHALTLCGNEHIVLVHG